MSNAGTDQNDHTTTTTPTPSDDCCDCCNHCESCFRCIINKNVSLRTQLLTLFASLTIISGGITLGICLGMLYALGDSAYTSSKSIILDNTKSNALNLGNVVAEAIDQRLTTVSESVTLVSSLYSQILLEYANFSSHETLLAPEPSFREYYFSGECHYPKCPKDYGPIAPRSRIPYLAGFQNGSLQHSSVFLYSSAAGVALRNDSSWNRTFSQNPQLFTVLNGLAYQDVDFNVLYNQGPNSTVMFYLSAQVFDGKESENYYSLHRTYPGILKNDTSYNPPARPWNSNAPVGSVYFYGPYQETFTKQLVITLSSKQKSVISHDYPVSVVSAAVLLIKDLEIIVNQIQYANNGFGALLTVSNDVLVWGNETDIYNYQTGTFKVLSDFDPVLATYTLNTNSVIEYTDIKGRDWYVAVEAFFPSGTEAENALVMLVFSERSEAEVPLTSLKHNIDSTTSSVTISTVIIVVCTIGAVMVFVSLIIVYIAHPLNIMRNISGDLIKLAAEDEEHRDYTEVLQKAYYNITRSDEVGILASDYYHVICMLQNNVLKKRAAPKNPPNPFYIAPNQLTSPLTWESFYEFLSRSLIAINDPALSYEQIYQIPAGPQEMENPDANLDVLASLSKQIAAKGASNPAPGTNPYASVELRDIEAGPIAPSTTAQNANGSYTAFAQQKQPEQVSYLTIAPSKSVGLFSSLKSQLYLFTFLLLAGLIVAFVLTVVQLHNEGADWTNESGDQLISVQVLNLQEISQTKAEFVKSYFQQLSVDLLVASKVLSLVMDGSLNRPNFATTGFYVPSYSITPGNPYSAAVDVSYNFSSYFIKTDDGCPGTTCSTTHSATQTKLTSLFDLKLRSYFYENNFVSFYQFGLDSNGFTRYLPYQKSSANSDPTSCLIGDYSGMCHTIYENSLCASDAYPSYPAYDARCRSWYQLGVQEANPEYAYFQYPRTASNGEYVLTGVVPIRANNTASGAFFGVLNSNYLISTLSNAINTLTILQSGYCYLIDSTNVSAVILHPNLPSNCQQVSCAEGFSSSEYTTFFNDVLAEIAAHPLQPITTTYTKQGDDWRLSTYPVSIGSVDYTLLVTVPNSEVIKVSTDTQNSINSTVAAMIAVFVIVIVIFIIAFYFFARALVRAIVTPINDLRLIFEQVKNQDYTSEIPKKATSLDLKVLLEALSNLLIALRFGSDSFARGSPQIAEKVFNEALNVFQLTGNKRGVGACYNNLAAVELSKGNFAKAEELYLKAIENAKELQQELAGSASEHDKRRIERVLSDRQGNLVVTYLEQKKFSEAFSLLERLLEEDKRTLYVKGCVVKQGTLGQYYLKQQEISSAEKYFTSALQFIEQTEGMNLDDSTKEVWNHEEMLASKQIAFYNKALLIEAKETKNVASNNPTVRLAALESIVSNFLVALIQTPVMHTNTVKNILISLKRYFHQFPDWNKYEHQIDLLAERFDFKLASKAGDQKVGSGSMFPKRVAFAIDYSGSMSGTKIRSARENLTAIFEQHISFQDSISITTFTSDVSTVLPLTNKANNEDRIKAQIDSLTSPSGSTALYDAVNRCLLMLQPSPGSASSSSNDWIVALTDGEDNSSRLSIETLNSAIAKSSVGVIVVGIGSDVKTELLTSIAQASKKGAYVFAKGDKKSIDEAFGQVAQIIQSQIILEDI